MTENAFEKIGFYSRKKEYGWMSNFERADMVIDGKVYKSNEHYYQSKKAKSEEAQDWVASAPTPFLSMKAGRLLKERGLERDNWDGIKVDIMLRGLRAKFMQCKDLRKKLIETGHRPLFEDSPSDMFWGGRLEDSKNMLGKLLEQVRDEMRKIDGGDVISGWCPYCKKPLSVAEYCNFCGRIILSPSGHIAKEIHEFINEDGGA